MWTEEELQKMSERATTQAGGGCPGLEGLDETLVRSLDECYHVAVEDDAPSQGVLYLNSREEIEAGLWRDIRVEEDCSG